MKTIITVQHTQSVHHTNGMVGSVTDWDLSPLGKEQAERIAAALQKELTGKEVLLYTSDLKRAVQTAEAIGRALQTEPVPRRELRERDLGKCCGRSVKWLREHIEQPENTVDDRLFSDAESRRDEWNRLKPFFEEVMHVDAETVMLVSHGDLLSVWNSMFIGLPPESLSGFEAFGPSGGVSCMTINDKGKRTIRKLGDLSYMR